MDGVAVEQTSGGILTVTHPVTLGPFKRDSELSNGTGQTYIAHRFERRREGHLWHLVPEVPGHGEAERNVFRYLETPTGIVTAEQDESWTSEDWERYAAQRDAYDDSLGALARITTLAAVELFPKTTLHGETRMGRSISTTQVDPLTHVVLLRISRGGDTPTAHAKRVLGKILHRRPQVLQATAQRKTGPHGKLEVEFSIKGGSTLKDEKTLKGKILYVPEQALATGSTLVDVLGKIFAIHESTPLHLIVGALNACEDGIRRVLDAFPLVSTTILVSALHNSLTPKWYLDDPGMGDGGAEEALAPD